jgi:hypothetical protein
MMVARQILPVLAQIPGKFYHSWAKSAYSGIFLRKPQIGKDFETPRRRLKFATEMGHFQEEMGHFVPNPQPSTFNPQPISATD